jgi:hypothetical protein
MSTRTVGRLRLQELSAGTSRNFEKHRNSLQRHNAQESWAQSSRLAYSGTDWPGDR